MASTDNGATLAATAIDSVKEYYGKVLAKSSDLKTNACCTGGAPPPRLRKALSKIHDEVMSRYYGCGFIAPDLLEGCTVLDLGCGAGRDCYMLSQFVGEVHKLRDAECTTPARSHVCVCAHGVGEGDSGR